MGLFESTINLSNWKAQYEKDTEEQLNEALNQIKQDALAIFLQENQLKVVPPNIKRYAHCISHLDLSFNLLADIPKSILNCKKLKVLDVRKNEITVVPKAICDLRALDQLLLSMNHIKSFDISSSIKILDLSYNNITLIPTDFFKKLPSLQYLNLDSNQINHLPDDIGESIRELNISRNKLISIPLNLSNATKLLLLDVSHNQINNLPDSIFDLIYSLQKLYLNGNPIQLLPDLSDLISLIFLDLSDTLITELPISIAKLAQLKFLSVGQSLDNDLSSFVSPPGSIICKGLPSIVNYLRHKNY